MGHGNIGDISGGTQHQAYDIRVGVLIAGHVLHHKSPDGKIAGDIQLRRLLQHHPGHKLVEPAPHVPERRVLLVIIPGIHRIVPLLKLFQKLVHFVGRGLAVIVQTYHIVPV